jgi:hypothetical protein
MHLIILSVLLVVIVVFVVVYVNLVRINYEPIADPITMFDNTDVPLIDPPDTIVIEGNTHQCHKQLTPCTSHMDCDMCREGLANCQYFEEAAKLVMHDDNGEEIEFNIEAGQSYCLALDRERARSCNPHTGVWLLVESPVGFSLLCSCLTPGLVTQLNVYGDCDVAVGCQPHGHIRDLNESPLACVCNEGFVADYNSITNTPFCRPLRIRDIIYDESVFPRAPCPQGYVRVDHPALDERYRQEFRLGDICVPDPCSIDPISGQRTRGTLQYYNLINQIIFKYCRCPIAENLYSVYSEGQSALGESILFGNPVKLCNACIRPFNTNMRSLRRIDYKAFWGRENTYFSDDDIVAAVARFELSDARYERILHSYLTPHPNANVQSRFILKFSTSYSPALEINNVYSMNIYEHYILTSRATNAPCFYPGDEGRCIVYNPFDCIRRHANGQVNFAQITTGRRCYLSREGNTIRIWNRATEYLHGRYPVALRCNALFCLVRLDHNYNTILLIFGGNVTSTDDNIINLARILDTYPNYSIL